MAVLLCRILFGISIAFSPLMCNGDTAGLPDDEFTDIKDYIIEREPKLYTLESIKTDPRSDVSEWIVGLRFRVFKSNAEKMVEDTLPHRGYDYIRYGGKLNDTEVVALFEADLPHYIQEVRDEITSFDLYPVEVKIALVDSHFTNYSTQYMYNLINDPDKNWVQVCVNYTHDPLYWGSTNSGFISRVQSSCSMMMDYALVLGHSNSTYNPCFNDLMFPYGPEIGDNINERNDDASSDEILLAIPFPFFDHNHDSLWVNTNGVISFLRNIWEFTPEPFPLHVDTYGRLVAPYWADVDTTNGGEVYYREITNPDDILLKRASIDIRRIFPRHYSFTASWILIATWDNVAFFGASNTGKEKRNTFQCVLVTNGKHSFAIYNYDDITWTTGFASGGDEDTGLGGIPAQVGFNGGDGDTSHTVQGSRTDDIVNIDRRSNVNKTGRYVFQIDNKDITEGGCNTEGVLSIYPTVGYMLGGEKVTISGPCIDPANSDKIWCKFSDQEVQGNYENHFMISCTTPIFYEIGRLEFRLSVDGGATYDDYRGIFTVLSIEHMAPSVIRQNKLEWNILDTLTIEWEKDDLDSGNVKIYLYRYVEDLITGNAALELDDDWPINVVSNTGSYSFSRDQQNQYNHYIGVFRIADDESELDTHPRSLWGDVHNLKWRHKANPQFCKVWSSSEAEKDESFLEDLEPCPCTLQQARVDFGRYSPHPYCNERSSHSENCDRNEQARHCVRVNTANQMNAGQQCCYDNSGNLLDGPDGGGTAHRIHHGGISPFKMAGTVPYLSHYLTDLLPWELCCSLFDLQCNLYYRKRPSDLCQEYQPPTPGGGIGDPHFITLDGLEYTFNGHGEFTLVQTPNDTFVMQARMEELKSGNTTVAGATVFTAIVMQDSESDRVQVQVNERRILDVWIKTVNGTWERVDFEQEAFWDYQGVSVVKDETFIRNRNRAIVTVKFPVSEISLQFTANEGSLMLSFLFFGPPSLKGTTQGLMGTWNDDKEDDLVTPDGKLLPIDSSLNDIHYHFGLNWNVSEFQTLFYYDGGKTHTTTNNYDYLPIINVPQNISDEVTMVCGNNPQCKFDFQVTGDILVATESKESVELFEEVSEDTKTVISCGQVTAPNNGSRTVTKHTEGGKATFRCHEGFNLIGPEESVCTQTGSWSNTEPICEAVDCGTPVQPENGYVNITCTEYECVADFACLPGYLETGGSQERKCLADGSWDGGILSCEADDIEASSTLQSWVWIVVGVVCAVVVTVLVVLILCCIVQHCRRKKKKTTRNQNKPLSNTTRKNPAYCPDDEPRYVGDPGTNSAVGRPHLYESVTPQHSAEIQYDQKVPDNNQEWRPQHESYINPAYAH
ncbi:sushi domain-containing protein 2-like [Glandiceps talaboti]